VRWEAAGRAADDVLGVFLEDPDSAVRERAAQRRLALRQPAPPTEEPCHG
jgi:hypothetical protein